MKKLLHIVILILGMVSVFYSCINERADFMEPEAKFTVEKTTFDVLEPVYIENLGAGELFSFWPGDEGQVFGEKNLSRNAGLAPNRGIDFEYSYLRSGTYTMTVVASSFDEHSGEFVQSVDSIHITINPGNNGNNFTRFAIDNAFAGYSPEGIFDGEFISIPIGFFNRAYGISDTEFAKLINKRPPLFSVNSSTAKVYSEEGDLLIGRGDDDYDLNLLNEESLEPIVRKFTVVQDNYPREYSVAAMFYPELEELKVMGFKALKYSKDGLSTISEEEIADLQLAYPDESYFGVFLIGVQPDELKTAKVEFELDSSIKIFPADSDQEVLSGITELDFSNPPIKFRIEKKIGSFKVQAKFSIYTLIF